jgi:ABC-type polysaccharide/polyol phosphate export permease
MYLTPVIYPKDIMPEEYRWIFGMNPMYHLLELFRAPIYAGWAAGPGTMFIAGVSSFLAVILGWWFFTLKADEFSYRV